MPKKHPRLLSDIPFQVGDKVRVKRGVKDVDSPDMPMGGWVGTVTHVQGDDTFTVRWSKETMQSMHPVFQQRCEIDGLDAEEYVLTGEDLEPDTGGRLEIEQPEKISTRPLSARDQDDRVRMVFGLSSNDALPAVDDSSLERYAEHLSKQARFPFTAEHVPVFGRPAQVEVLGLVYCDPDALSDEVEGLLCEVRLGGKLAHVPIGALANLLKAALAAGDGIAFGRLLELRRRRPRGLRLTGRVQPRLTASVLTAADSRSSCKTRPAKQVLSRPERRRWSTSSDRSGFGD